MMMMMMIPNYHINQVYETVIVNNKSIIFNILLLIFCIAFTFEYYHDQSTRATEIDHFINIGPPEHCTAGTKPYNEIGWSEWIVHRLYRDERDAKCLEYIAKVLQPRYPNPLDSLLSVTAKIMGFPILVLFNTLATAIHTANRLFAQTVFTTILIIIAIIYVCNKWAIQFITISTIASHSTPSKNPVPPPPSSTTTTTPIRQLTDTKESLRDMILDEFKTIYGDAMNFIKLPYFNLDEEPQVIDTIKQMNNNEIEMKIMKKKQEAPIMLTPNEINEICTQDAINSVD
jgi:hypothetical protein